MWFLSVALLLSILSIGEYFKKKQFVGFFYLIWSVLWVMLVLRYGQGTDYYAYYLQYEYIDSTGSFWINALGHGEIGWYILMLLGKKIGLNFFVFLGIVSSVMMLSLLRAIKRYSPYKMISLLLLYPTFYLTYCYSAIRQGLVLCLFLGWGIELLLKKNFFWYYLFVLLLALFHTSAIVLLVVPALINWRKKKAFIFLGVILLIPIVAFYGQSYILSATETYRNVEVSVLAIIVRIIVFVVVRQLYLMSKKVDSDVSSRELIDLAYHIYEIGFIIFLSLSWTSTLSQRLTMPLKSVEILLIPTLLYYNSKKLKTYFCRKKLQIVTFSFLLCVAIMNVEYVKNIYSYINQGNYRSFVTPLNYPYCSVFNQQEIYNYITNFDEEF